ncbi:M56 family metallopeptidase [Sphingomonas sp. NFR15]|uniref:M56 family metallopeptidase n=1 Tax=Sphingomonas sp. NFR15 TaxID=1566282 RepID=UPI00088EE005|nr:M56 family metallopeptidase [Sphingomonas sp. NFR15]SDA31255.1 Signal transducer regulating beta-lactamase production, contains metallopeptidase domain [Sphingomonas sp. NFR15]
MIGWALEALAGSAVLMALVMAIRGPVRRAFGPDVAYALWALPVLRLCLPPLPEMVSRSVRHVAALPVAQASEPVTILLAAPARAAARSVGWDAFVPVVAAVWLVGALGFAGWHVFAHRRFCRDLLDGAAPLEARGAVQVIETPVARGPLAFGIWRRYVAFPTDFGALYDPAERDLALAHELGHHARGDLVANWIALAVLALHWFNPLAWYAFRAFRTDQEVANDARVLAGRPAITRHTYACAILKAAHGGAVSAACHLHTIDDLKGRLRMLTTRRISRVRLAGGSAAVALLGVAALGLTASGTQAAEHVRTRVKTVTGIDITSFDSMPTMAALAPASSRVPVIPPASSHVPVMPPASSEVPVAPLAPSDVAIAPVEPPVSPLSPVEPVPPVPPIAVSSRDWHDMRDIAADVPRVTSAHCGGPDRPTVIRAEHDGKRSITICTDRIDRAAARGAALAANSAVLQRSAYRSALAGLRRARANVAHNTNMPVDARHQALDSIDASLDEIQAHIDEQD